MKAEEYFEKEYGKDHLVMVAKMEDFVSLYALIEEYANQSKWISVDSPPEASITSCLIALENKSVFEGFYSSFSKRFFSILHGEFVIENPPTHWRTLPEAP